MIHGWGTTDRGVVRSQNQDAYYLSLEENFALAMVCDGMGGARAGNVASALAVSTASDYLNQLPRDTLCADPDHHLRRAAQCANTTVFQKALSDPLCQGMGTTMVAALVLQNMVHLLNIGDSRAYRIAPGGICKLTHDHSFVQDLVDHGDITSEQARVHPQRNLITRAIGSEPNVRSDLFQLDCHAGEFLLLCSDGLSNPLSEDELLFEILYGGPPEECCQRLLQAAIQKGAPDNVTAVLLHFL